jgi:hypothetical protein
MIHTELAAHLSVPLSRLMMGSMREAKAGEGELMDVDEQTFVRFCQYAYTGDYSPCTPLIFNSVVARVSLVVVRVKLNIATNEAP